MKKTITCIIAILCIISTQAKSQSNISLLLTGIGYDFSDRKNVNIYNRNIADGKIVADPGLQFAFEVYSGDITGIKFTQSANLDACNKIAGATQIMLTFRLFKIYKHSIHLGIGPKAFYRQTWQNINGYINDDIYQNGDVQYKICWLSGELDYNYRLDKKNDITFCIGQTTPVSAGVMIGIKHWFSRKSTNCITCPSFK